MQKYQNCSIWLGFECRASSVKGPQNNIVKGCSAADSQIYPNFLMQNIKFY